MFSSASVWSFALALSLARADTVGSLYGYGSGISGLPIIVSDDVAILGWGTPSFATVASNLTFFHVNTSLIAEPNNTAVASNWTTPYLYIETREGALSDVAFTEINGSSHSTKMTTGFDFYGRQLLWLGDADAGVGRSFWASPMNETGFYKLFWNSDNAAVGAAVPVTLKSQPPPSVSK